MNDKWATLQAMTTRQQKLRQITSEVTGLHAQVEAKLKEAETLGKEIEDLSLRLEDAQSSGENK